MRYDTESFLIKKNGIWIYLHDTDSISTTITATNRTTYARM